MPTFTTIAAAIDLRVRQLESEGVGGLALANQMLGHMAELDHVYRTASDAELMALCRRHPAFERYARLMEEVSERNDAMHVAGTHPYADLPRLPEPLGRALTDLLRDAAEIEREHCSAVDGAMLDQAGADRLVAMGRRWADDLERVVEAFRGSDLRPRAQAVVQDVLRTTAERMMRLG